jgi:antitoxin ParD1/3/4
VANRANGCVTVMVRMTSASEIVRDALRRMEEQEKKLQALHAHLAEGEQQIARGEGIENFLMTCQ